MARKLVDDELWEIVRPLLPSPSPHKTSAGRKRLDERRIFTGILFILQSGLPWENAAQGLWLHQFRRLRVRYERRADVHKGFLRLGCAIICWRTLRKALRDPFPFC